MCVLSKCRLGKFHLNVNETWLLNYWPYNFISPRCSSILLYTYSRRERGLHVLTFAGVREGAEPLLPRAGESQQVNDSQQVRRHHRDAEVEQAVAEADWPLESTQRLCGHAVIEPRLRFQLVFGPTGGSFVAIVKLTGRMWPLWDRSQRTILPGFRLAGAACCRIRHWGIRTTIKRKCPLWCWAPPLGHFL